MSNLPKLLTLLVLTTGLAPAARAADSKPAAKGRVEGQVLSGGKGVAAAAVRLFYSSVDGPVQAGLAGEALTDSEGRFTVDGLATAPYQVCVRAQGVSCSTHASGACRRRWCGPRRGAPRAG